MKQTTLEKKKKILGGKIHKLLNTSVVRKLTREEYTNLVLLVSGVFDLISSELALRDQELLKEIEGRKLTNTKEESDSDWFYGKGWNEALTDVSEVVRKGV